MRMKALTLWRPYEELIKRGLKKYETRSWPAPAWLVGQRIAIHGAKKFDSEAWEYGLRGRLEACGVDAKEIARASYWNIGRVVCTARLAACHEMEWPLIESLPALERSVGGWEPGRFAWELEDVRPVEPSISWWGQRGLWWWDAPEGIE